MAKVKKEVSVVTKVITDTSKADAPIKKTAEVMKKAGKEIEQAAQQAAAAVERAFSSIRTSYPNMGIRGVRSQGLASSFGAPVDDFTRRNTLGYMQGATGGLSDNSEKYGRQNLALRVRRGKEAQRQQEQAAKQAQRQESARVKKEEQEQKRQEKEWQRYLKESYQKDMKFAKELERQQNKEQRRTAREMGPDMQGYRQRVSDQKGQAQQQAIEDKRKAREDLRTARAMGPDMIGYRDREALNKQTTQAANRQSKAEEAAMRKSYAERTRKASQLAAREERERKRLEKEKETNTKRAATAAERALSKQAQLERKAAQTTQAMTNRGLGMGMGAMGFAGAALGSTLFAAGGASGLGAFGAIPGIMAGRMFQGAGMGLTVGGAIGSVGGPVGTVLGGGLGALVGGGLGSLTGLLEGSIPAAIGALVDGVKTTVHFLYQGASRLVKAGAEYERQVTKFGVLAGSPEAGRKLYGGIESLSQKTPYSMRALSTNAELLLGYGVKNDNILPTLSRLGDVAGGDATRLERLRLAFGQVMAQGKLAGQELRQFSEAGVGISDFAQTAGVSTFMFRAMMEQSLIPANVMVETINRLTSSGGRFAGMNEKISETTSGKWNMMMGTLEKYERRLGDFLNRRINAPGILASMTSWIEPASQKIESFIDKAVAWGERAVAGLSKPFNYFRDASLAFAENVNFGSGVDNAIPSWERFGQLVIDAGKKVSMTVASVIDDVSHLINMMDKYGPSGMSKRNLGNGLMETPSPHALGGPLTFVHDQVMGRIGVGKGGATDRFLESWGFNAKFLRDPVTHIMTRALTPDSTPAQDAVGAAFNQADLIMDARKIPDFYPQSKRSQGPGGFWGRPTMYGNQGLINDMGFGDWASTKKDTPQIATKDQPSGQVNAMLTDIVSKMREGFAPLDRFSNTMKVLNEGRWGQPGKPDTAAMTQKQFEFGRYEAFQELRKKYEGANKVSFPTGGNERGSEAAARLMLESIEVQINNDMDMMEIMKEAERDRKKQLKELEDLNKFFETNKDKMTLFIDVAGGP